MCPQSDLQLEHQPEARVVNILVPNFGHLTSLVWAKLLLVCFRDVVLPDFLDFLLVPTDPRHGRRIAVDISQGLRICARVYCF